MAVSLPSPTPKAIKRLQCTVCGRTIDHSADELLEFTRKGWPQCCNEVMVLLHVTEEIPALMNDNPPDR
jgi:hypothetical protein